MKVKDLQEVLGKADANAEVVVISRDERLDNAMVASDAFEVVRHRSDNNDDWTGFYIVTN